ncbi:MAG TPA: GNAT family N-acetyltransferase [Candidatus Acidoferrum sp.]|nr:GNAT family N-acetyltransferase [Candidatus Acidoferrum sp.]
MPLLIKAKRVNLRTLRHSDAESLCRYIRDPENGRWLLIPWPYQLSDAHVFIKNSRKWAHQKSPTNIGCGIVLKETGEVIGGIGMHKIDRRMKNAEIGCWIGKPYRGTGLMVEAMKAMLKYAFDELKLKRVYAHIFVENVASRKMVEKCGFVREGRLRASHLHHRHWRDSYLYSILKEDFRIRRSE